MMRNLRHRLRAAFSRSRSTTTPTAASTKPETYDEWVLRTTREYRALVEAFNSTFNISSVKTADYTREEKIALTVKTLGIDYDESRIAANRAQRPPARSRPSVRLAQRDTTWIHSSAIVQTGKGVQRRSETVRHHAGRNLMHVTVCAYCGQSGTREYGPDGKLWHLDHVHPLSKGGADAMHNIVKACAFCNLSKGNRFRTPLPGSLRADGVRLG